jgi:hypothetical protein
VRYLPSLVGTSDKMVAFLVNVSVKLS